MPSSRFAVLTVSWIACHLAANVRAQLESCGDDLSNVGEECVVTTYDIASECSTSPTGICGDDGDGGGICFSMDPQPAYLSTLCSKVGCGCSSGVCTSTGSSSSFVIPCAVDLRVCGDDVVCDDPHMQGLRGQRIDWSGVNGGWYSLIKDTQADLHINVRLTAPLPDEFADRQLITGVSIMSGGHSLAIEVDNPYTIATGGCPADLSPCLANGGLRAVVDGEEVNDILRFSRNTLVADEQFMLSASNLPVECRQFGGDKIWARMYEEMVQGRRALGNEESFEDWIMSFHNMAAPEWCIKYIAENGLAELQSTHAIFKVETSNIAVRLNAGVNHQGGGELDWDSRVLPDLEFWQMDIGLDGLDVDSSSLTGILGETARPVYDLSGLPIMKGLDAIRGDVDDYRVRGPVGTHFALLDKEGGGHT